MPWYKSWLDTRSRFLIGLALIGIAACSIVIQYPTLRKILPTVIAMNVPEGPLTAAIEDAAKTMQTYRGYVWQQWFGKNLTYLATLFAALLGSGNPLSGSSRGVLFSLALPVSRNRWLGTRIALGLAELAALAVVPSLAIVLLSPLIGERYSAADALVHGASVFVGAAVFFALALLLSSLFNDLWRPLLLTCLVAIAASLGTNALGIDGPAAVMSAESYFRGQSLPWLGLLAGAAATAVLLYGAMARVERRDF